jgi:hypothetical protein
VGIHDLQETAIRRCLHPGTLTNVNGGEGDINIRWQFGG